MPQTRFADIVVPRIFSEYTIQRTLELSRFIHSGAVVVEDALNEFLRGGGTQWDAPFWNPLAQDTENVSTDDPAQTSTPHKIGSGEEKIIRLSRNNSWARMDEVVSNAGSDPLAAIQTQLAEYWALRQQKMLIAMISGINKDNAASNSGDYAHDIAGADGGSAGANTRINTSAFIDMRQLLGDAKEFSSILFVHSVVEAKLRKNNLIVDIPDSQEGGPISTFMGARLVYLDGMPSGPAVVRKNGSPGVAGMYESWLFAPGTIRLGMIPRPTQPEHVEYYPDRGNGGGETVLHQRFEFLPNFPGHTYSGSRPAGGPSNAATANNLNHAGSWSRVYADRKRIPYARLITRES